MDAEFPHVCNYACFANISRYLGADNVGLGRSSSDLNLILGVLTAATDLSVGDVEEAALRVFVFHFEGQDEVALLIEWAGWIILT